jgi:hypothetical protein
VRDAGGRLLGGIAERTRRYFLEPEVPTVALEVRPRCVGIVRAGREKGRVALSAVASLALPEGTLSLSVSQPNLARPEIFQEVLRSLAEKAGMSGGGRVGLVLPDTAARVALVPVAEIKARGRAELEEMVRFRLRKAVPFDARESEVACILPGAGGTMAVAAAIYRPVLAQYEDACRALGLHPGLVELSGFALLGAQPSRPGDHLLVNWDEGYVTLILARDSWPLLVRTLIGDPAASPEEVGREIGNTALYYRERLGGADIQSATVRSGFLAPDEALAVVGGALGLQAELLQPPRGLAEGPWAAAHAVAGAAACVLREAA